jgi:hypothetical protein
VKGRIGWERTSVQVNVDTAVGRPKIAGMIGSRRAGALVTVVRRRAGEAAGMGNLGPVVVAVDGRSHCSPTSQPINSSADLDQCDQVFTCPQDEENKDRLEPLFLHFSSASDRFSSALL